MVEKKMAATVSVRRKKPTAPRRGRTSKGKDIGVPDECPSCGKPIRGRSKACPVCGAALDPPAIRQA
jgi:rubrerythrin